MPPAQQGRGARARRHPLGDDPRRGLPAQPRRHRRRGDARPRSGDGRDDRGRPGDRRATADHVANLFAPGDAMAAVIANQSARLGDLTGRAHRARRGAVRDHIIVNVSPAGRRSRRAPDQGARMTTSPPHRRQRPRARADRACRRRRPPVANGLATAWMIGACSSPSSRWLFVIAHVVARASVSSARRSSPRTSPIISQPAGRRHGPGHRRHAPDHRGAAYGHPARRTRRDLPQRVRQQRRLP